MKYFKILTIYFFVVLIIFIIIEFIFRLIGEKPFNPAVTIEKITPSNPISNDSLIGYSLLPGKYTLHYQNGYSFTTTHNKFGERMISNTKKFESLPKIAIYGDSNFYGFGLQDNQTWAYLFQQKNKSIQVINHAVFGHSLYLNYLKFKNKIQSGESPIAAVFLIASYDFGRQTMNAQSRKYFVVNQKVANVYKYPCLEIKEGKLVKKLQPLHSTFINELSRHSSFSNFVETRVNTILDNRIDYKTISNAVLDSIITISRKNKIEPVFALMYDDQPTREIKQKLDKLKCKNVFINYDLSDKKYSLLPYDNHPNAYTNTLYCKKIDSLVQPIIQKNARTKNL
jgi:hypothetical protein